MTLAEKIILACIEKLPEGEVDFNILKRQLTSQGHIRESELSGNLDKSQGMPAKTELLSAYHKLLTKKRILPNKKLEKLLMRRAVRTLSGVTIVTSLVKPYPCPGECVYCPLDERMPKSYLAEEPAAMRALMLAFDPYEQMAKRIEALEKNGHPTDKVELIIKGGTWNSYPLPYQYWFILRSFEAANETGKWKSPLEGGRGDVGQSRTSPKPMQIGSPSSRRDLTEASPLIDLKKELFRQQRLNEHAKHRIIGLTLETRPDCINYHTIWQMREMGCTRLEIGVQHTDNKVLALTKRGHTAEEAMRATELLKNYGFKADYHLMPQLPGATATTDLVMLEEIFKNPGYRPDMIKIYPCTVVKGSELYDWFKDGKYKAYPTEDLLKILKQFKTVVPRYCRISRLIRDIPGQYIEEGNKVTNLRQVIQMEMKREGTACKCLRCREIGHVDIAKIKDLTPHLFIDEYKTHGGMEYFLSFEDKKRQVVFAFCRLRIVDTPVIHPNKKLNSYEAYIRELHTYGQLIPIKQENKKSRKQDHVKAQHRGLGKKLVKKAEQIVKQNKIEKLAVISGVGVRDYYRQLGYRLEKTYMVKNLKIKD